MQVGYFHSPQLIRSASEIIELEGKRIEVELLPRIYMIQYPRA